MAPKPDDLLNAIRRHVTAIDHMLADHTILIDRSADNDARAFAQAQALITRAVAIPR
jgi:hypothetical protein